MSASTGMRRTVCGLGAAAALTVTLAVPASARPESPTYTTGGTAVSVAVPRAPDPRPHATEPPAYNSTWLGWSPPSATSITGQSGAAAGSGGTLQYLQIGLGALAGAALASAGALTVAARGRRGHLAHA